MRFLDHGISSVLRLCLYPALALCTTTSCATTPSLYLTQVSSDHAASTSSSSGQRQIRRQDVAVRSRDRSKVETASLTNLVAPRVVGIAWLFRQQDRAARQVYFDRAVGCAGDQQAVKVCW